MIRATLRQSSILGALFLIAAILRGGTNSWTGGSPTSMNEAPSLVSADPNDPNVVYGAFGHLLYRSGDGGRTWIRLHSFDWIRAILAHPASPSTVYVAGVDGAFQGVFRSTDSGQTWTSTLGESSVSVLAGSPTDPSTVFAGSFYAVFKTTDAGANWSQTSIEGAIAALVINPREPSVVYAGAESLAGFGYYPGSFGRSDDGGATFLDLTPEAFGSARAIGVDPVASSTIYLATVPNYYDVGVSGVLRSENSGLSWTGPGEGLPEDVRSLVVDPRVSGTLYAGTSSGLYRSRDAGRRWTAFGQRLAGRTIDSLSIAADGRRLYAGTPGGTFALEVASGPLDVAAGSAGGSWLLTWNADRLAVGTLDANGHWTLGPLEDPSATWTAIAIATGGGDRTHVLWQCGDGRSAVEVVGSSGRVSATVFAADPGWIPGDLSVRADGKTSMLWTNADGRMRIATVGSSGAASLGPEYGPAVGWSAVAIADGSDGQARVLWRSTDGRAALSLHRDGAMLSSVKWAADPGWTVEDVAVGADDRVRLLRITPDGTAEVSIVETGGVLTAAAAYASPGLTPRSIAAGADGLTRLLFSGNEGSGDLVILDAANALTARYAVPAANAATLVVATAAELEAALVPANAGAQILVRAGEYELASPLTVPDRAILAGEGVMTLDASRLPAGIAATGRTVLRSGPGLVGDVLTLGDGSVLRGLVVEDAAGRDSGNPVAVVSRDAGDSVSARILDCEIVNPNPSGVAPQGPTGRGLVVWTRNPNLGQDPPPHEGARLRLQMTRSLVRSPATGIGVFTINFASQAAIDADLQSNVIGGGLTAAGGVSRPDAVTGAAIHIHSRRNLYRSDSADPTPLGWNLQGGTTAPIPNLASQASTFNRLRLQSQDDRIEGFGTGIFAAGATRSNPLSEPSSSNRIDLDLRGTRLQTVAADLTLFGASTFVEGVSPGDDNTVRAAVREAKGSGPRSNAYVDSVGDLGTGNRLEIAGSAEAFAQSNEGFDPAPPAEFFASGE